MASDPKQMELNLPEATADMTARMKEVLGIPEEPRQVNIDHLPPYKWLAALDKQIWAEKVAEHYANMTGHGWKQRYRVVHRKLTETEWAKLQEIVREEGLLTSMHNCGFGFTCGMLISEHPEATYPGVPLEAKRLLFVESHHLPQKEDRFEEGWQAFSPFTHSEQNTKWLAQYGMDAPKSKGHYSY